MDFSDALNCYFDSNYFHFSFLRTIKSLVIQLINFFLENQQVSHQSPYLFIKKTLFDQAQKNICKE